MSRRGRKEHLEERLKATLCLGREDVDPRGDRQRPESRRLSRLDTFFHSRKVLHVKSHCQCVASRDPDVIYCSLGPNDRSVFNFVQNFPFAMHPSFTHPLSTCVS